MYALNVYAGDSWEKLKIIIEVQSAEHTSRDGRPSRDGRSAHFALRFKPYVFKFVLH